MLNRTKDMLRYNLVVRILAMPMVKLRTDNGRRNMIMADMESEFRIMKAYTMEKMFCDREWTKSMP